MRCWHKDLIQFLPKKQLVGQWRECCAIMSGMARKGTVTHPLVKKITDYPLNEFYVYTRLIYAELCTRGYSPRWDAFWTPYYDMARSTPTMPASIFADWHTDRYLRQCLYNLQEKYDCGVITENEWQKIVDRFGAEW